MKVWITYERPVTVSRAFLQEPEAETDNHHKVHKVVRGAESMVLVEREELRHVLEHHGAAGSRSCWCNWPDCQWMGADNEWPEKPHSGNCPLREEA